MKLNTLITTLDNKLHNRTTVQCKKTGTEAINYTNTNDSTITINNTECNTTREIYILTQNTTNTLILQGQNPYNYTKIPLNDISTLTIT